MAAAARGRIQATGTVEENKLKGDKIHVLMTPAKANLVHCVGCMQESCPVIGQWQEWNLVLV